LQGFDQGKKFDSSVDRGRKFEFVAGQKMKLVVLWAFLLFGVGFAAAEGGQAVFCRFESCSG
jgi:hypothetical protein